MACQTNHYRYLLNCLLLFLLLFAVNGRAATFNTLVNADNNAVINGRILSSHSIISAEDTILLGFELQLAPGWHIYGERPGKTGLPTIINWQSNSLTIRKKNFPASQDGKYKKQVVFLAEAKIKEPATPHHLTVHYSFLACNAQGCTPRKGHLETILQEGDSGHLTTDEVLEILLTADAQERETPQSAAITALSPTKNGDHHNSDNCPKGPDTAHNENNLALILVFALLGGIILNFMPCVLPVISLKLFSLAKESSLPRAIRLRNGMAFTCGIIISMWVLAGIIIILKHAGTNVGWGFQFQQPYYIITLALIMALVAFNLFGLFELNWAPQLPVLKKLRRTSHGSARQFWEGILTVILSTPCSAPLLAPAIGMAFTGTIWKIILIFTFIGLGIALPYLLATGSQNFQKIIPRPGKWMEIFKLCLGFASLAVTIWLTSILGTIWGNTAQNIISYNILLLALFFWIQNYNKTNPTNKKWRWPLWLLIIATIISSYCIKPPLDNENWRKYDPATLRQALQNGQPVFVDFTAEWCLTCQQNEKLVLSGKQFLKAVNTKNILLMKADWTTRDDTIFEELQRHGKAGVPLYLLYKPDDPTAPQVLPEILTTDIINEALSKI